MTTSPLLPNLHKSCTRKLLLTASCLDAASPTGITYACFGKLHVKKKKESTAIRIGRAEQNDEEFHMTTRHVQSRCEWRRHAPMWFVEKCSGGPFIDMQVPFSPKLQSRIRQSCTTTPDVNARLAKCRYIDIPFFFRIILFVLLTNFLLHCLLQSPMEPPALNSALQVYQQNGLVDLCNSTVDFAFYLAPALISTCA